MTREEAINFLKGYLDEEVYTEKCRNAHEMAIKALEQEPILDKIKEEIIQLNQNGVLKIESGNEALFDIIDKYKAESEG